MAVRRVCRELRCEAEVLILGYTAPEAAPLLSRENLIQTLLSGEYAVRLAEAARGSGVRVRTHAAIDTGMNRIGFPAYTEETLEASVLQLADLAREPSLSLEGLFTHFARADEDGEEGAARTACQEARFEALRTRLSEMGCADFFCHTCNSAAFGRGRAAVLDGVRIGILLYGCGLESASTLPLSPVMRFCSTVTHVHTLLPGESVSYGGLFTASTPKQIATVSAGYADGLLRASSGGCASVHTASGVCSAPIVGRICMDQCMLDVTGLPVEVGDTVVFFGDLPGDAGDLARAAGSVDYELLCAVSGRVPRIERDGGDADDTD